MFFTCDGSWPLWHRLSKSFNSPAAEASCNGCSFFGGTDDEPVDFGLPNFPRNPTSAELAEPAKHLTEKGASSQI